METPIEVFLSYAAEDTQSAQELEKHLSTLQLQGLITWYTGKQAPGGTYWRDNINRHLNTAQIILLLVSPNFLASDYTYDEIQQALKRHNAKEALVIPIILRPTLWENTPLAKLQALPRGGKPMTKWSSRDLAFLEVTRGIQQAIEEVISNPSIAKPSASREVVTGSAERNKLEKLATDLNKSYSYIRGYEDILRFSDDPAEKAQAQQSIERQGILTRHYLDEYQSLANQLGVRIPPEIAQISAHLGTPGFSSTSP